MPQNKQLSWILLTTAIFGILVLPKLFNAQMFMDGILYAAVSKNLALGIGTFWKPVFNAFGIGGSPYFLEHPPLVYGIQAIAFKIFGTGFVAERIYSLFTALITIFVISQIWKTVSTESPEIKPLGWLPILLWIIIPVSSWTIINNVQENTMGVFSLSAILFVLKSNQATRPSSLLYALLAGVMLFAATFAKGVPGLFPLAAPAILWLFVRKVSLLKAVWQSLLLLFVPTLIYSLLLLMPEANDSLSFYLEHRLLGRIETAHTTGDRLYTLKKLGSEIAVPFAVSLILMLVFRIKKTSWKPVKSVRKYAWAFSVIGLSASLPLMLTMVQKRFYFAASLPYFGIAFALLIAFGTAKLIEKTDMRSLKHKIGFAASILLLLVAFAVTVFFYGKKGKKHNLLTDLEQVATIVPGNSIMDISPTLSQNWGLHCSIMRYHNISLSYRKKSKHAYLLIPKTENIESPEQYEPVKINMVLFDLYRYKTR